MRKLYKPIIILLTFLGLGVGQAMAGISAGISGNVSLYSVDGKETVESTNVNTDTRQAAFA